MAGNAADELTLALNYLGYMETFATGVSAGVFDLELADSSFGSRVIAVSHNYRELIEKRRLNNPSKSLYRETGMARSGVGGFSRTRGGVFRWAIRAYCVAEHANCSDSRPAAFR